jgi:uncharacterized membrane protein YbaN (DUF454 family)
MVKRGLKYFWIAVGIGVIVLGVVGALLPFHLGVPVIVLGLIVLLRNSRTARKHFIRAQRRHPKVFHPLRRLMRHPRHIPSVIWQAMLRSERFFLRRFRFMGRARRGLRRALRRR